MLNVRWVRNQEGFLVAVWTRGQTEAATVTRPTARIIPFSRPQSQPEPALVLPKAG